MRTIGVVVALVSLPGGHAHATTPIVIAGSQRMAPLLQRLADEYTKAHPDVEIKIEDGGTGNAIEALCTGKATVAALARPATRPELRRVQIVFDRDAIGVPIAVDALVITVKPDNPAEAITVDQLARVLKHKISRWDELGVALDNLAGPDHGPDCRLDHLEALRIERYLPPATSGVVQWLQSRVMNGADYTRAKREFDSAQDVANAVAKEVHALGVTRMGVTSGTKILAVRADADAPAVKPTPETVSSRAYALAHYLYLYMPGRPAGPFREFLKFVIGPDGQRIIMEAKAGPVPLPMLVDAQ